MAVPLRNALHNKNEVQEQNLNGAPVKRRGASVIADNDQPGRDADTGLQGNARLQRGHPRDQLQPRANRPLGVILMGLRIAEVDEDTVAHVFRHEAAEAAHRLGDAFLIGRNDLAQVLRVHAGGERRRADEVREHHRDLAALGGVLGLRLHCGDGYRGGSFGHRNEGRDRLQQLLAMAERRDADILEIVVGQPPQQLDVDVVGAEHLGILGEADPAEPTVDVQVQSPGLLSAAVFEKG